MLHDTGPRHPETCARLTAAKSALEAASFAELLHWFKPQPVESRWLEGIHSPDYRHYIEEACLQGRHFVDSGDTVVCQDSYHAALLAAGAAVAAVDAVLREGYLSAFSLTRPPGHHASTEKAMGFCLFNNIAIAAHYAEAAYGIERICILDWDVHHGNGTQDIFYESPSVLFCSLHQLPLFPHTGEFHETGMGAGAGHTVNCPFPGGAGIDLYLEALEHEILPKIEEFKPQLFLISAGFDAHKLDPLADARLESSDFHTLTNWILQQARTYSLGRVVSFLEGGYNLDALAESVAEHVRALTEQD
jgi:acetoin utilization deacetylase AcuC-like enzyme